MNKSLYLVYADLPNILLTLLTWHTYVLLQIFVCIQNSATLHGRANSSEVMNNLKQTEELQGVHSQL